MNNISIHKNFYDKIKFYPEKIQSQLIELFSETIKVSSNNLYSIILIGSTARNELSYYLTKDELKDTMKILNLISETHTTLDTDLEIVVALLKKLLNYINSSLSSIDNLEIENSNDLYKRLWNNKIKLEETIAAIEILDFS